MYAALIHTNDRSGGNNCYVGHVKADTVDDLANKDATERRQRSVEMKLWEEGRRSTIAFMNLSGLESFYDSCGDEQHYYRAQIRCAGRTEFYTHDRITYFRECLDRIAETRKAIRAAIKQRKRIEANRSVRAA